MLLLSKQERPDISPYSELPGQPLPGIRDYIRLMQVTHPVGHDVSLSVIVSLCVSACISVCVAASVFSV